MNRRTFLGNILTLAGAAVIKPPPLIFDMGANSSLYTLVDPVPFEDFDQVLKEVLTALYNNSFIDIGFYAEPPKCNHFYTERF